MDQDVKLIGGYTTYQIVGSVDGRVDGFYTFAIVRDGDSDLEAFCIAFGAIDLAALEYDFDLRRFTWQVIDVQSPARIAEPDKTYPAILQDVRDTRQACLRQGTRVYMSLLMARVGENMGMLNARGGRYRP